MLLPPLPEAPFWASRKRLMRLISWERPQKGTHVNIFGGDFGILGAFSQEGKKQEERIHPKIHSNIQIRIWEFCGQTPHCKDVPLMNSFGNSLRSEGALCALGTVVQNEFSGRRVCANKGVMKGVATGMMDRELYISRAHTHTQT